MPYNTVNDLPNSIKGSIPSENGRKIFLHAFNSSIDRGVKEEIAFREAWGALKNSGYEKDAFSKWIKKQFQDSEAPNFRKSASFKKCANCSWNLEGYCFTHDFNPLNVNKSVCDHWENEDYDAAISFEKETKVHATHTIQKIDEDKRLVYGWASVIEENGKPVVDLAGDIISEDELENAAINFMETFRVSKEMHEGYPVGAVVQSMVLTKQLQQNWGINLNKVGWFIVVKVYDDEAWAKIKTGQFKAFSIGGIATRKKVSTYAE